MIARNFLPVLLTPLAVVLFVSSACAAEVRLVRGRVVKVEPAANRITIQPVVGPRMTLAVTDASRLEISGQPAKLEQIQEGKRVRVTYLDQKTRANEVVLLKYSVVTTEALGREIKEALASVKDYTFQQKDRYEAELREVVHDLDDRIDDLEARTRDARAEMKKTLQDQISLLKKKRAALNERLAKVKSATADAWGDLKTGVGAAVTDLENALQKMLKE